MLGRTPFRKYGNWKHKTKSSIYIGRMRALHCHASTSLALLRRKKERKDIIRKVNKPLLKERITQNVDKIKYLREGIEFRDAELSKSLPSDQYTNVGVMIAKSREQMFMLTKHGHQQKLKKLSEKSRKDTHGQLDLSGNQLKKWVVNHPNTSCQIRK